MRLRLLLTAFTLALSATFAFSQAALSSGEHHVTLNGVLLWYKVAGQPHPSHAPLLYLHGGPGYNSYSFEHTIGTALKRHTQLIYLDERGSGRSQRPADKNYQMSALVSDVEALRQSLGVDRLSLMGHSFGGTIALQYAQLYPSHVQKLIIIDGASDMPATFALWKNEIERRNPSAWNSALANGRYVEMQQASKSGDTCALAKAIFAADLKALKRMDSSAFHQWQQFRYPRYQRQKDALDAQSGLHNTGEMSKAYFGPGSDFPCYRFKAFDKLTMPTLVVVGKYDGAIGVEQMRSLAAQLPDARFDLFQRSAHFPYAEQPGLFVRDVTAFLNRDNSSLRKQ